MCYPVWDGAYKITLAVKNCDIQQFFVNDINFVFKTYMYDTYRITGNFRGVKFSWFGD